MTMRERKDNDEREERERFLISCWFPKDRNGFEYF